MFTVSKTEHVEFVKEAPFLKTYTGLISWAILLGLFNDKDNNLDSTSLIRLYDNEKNLESRSLAMDIYTPVDDTAKSRPMVLVIHGGAMIGGYRNQMSQHTIQYCDSLAARGFVTASMDYRLGVAAKTDADTTTHLHIDSTDFARSVYRGLQDVRAAIRFLRSKADSLGVDPNRIYLVGNSSGGILALENTYATEEDDFPEYMYQDTLLDLGKLDAYGVEGNDSRANAVVSLWGGLFTAWILFAIIRRRCFWLTEQTMERFFLKQGVPCQTVQDC